MAWSVPSLVLATAAPSFAVSPCNGCYQMDWAQYAAGTDVASGLAFATSPADGATCGTVPVVTVSATEGGSPGAVNQTNPSTGLHSLAYNAKVEYRGEQVGYPVNAPFRIAGVSESDPGLVLNIGYNTTTTVTFAFSQPVQSLEFDILDITATESDMARGAYTYTDRVSFSENVQISGTMTHASHPTGVLPAGTEFYRTAILRSNSSVIVRNTITTTTAEPFTSFTVTYSAKEPSGWQFIALNDLNVCFA